MASINDGQSVNVNVPIGSSLTVYGSAFVTVDGNKTAINGPRRFGPYTTVKTLTIVGVSGASYDDQPSAQDTIGFSLDSSGKPSLDQFSKDTISNSGVSGKIYPALAASRSNAPYVGPVTLASGITVTAGVAAPGVAEYRYWTGNNARYFKVFGLGAATFYEQYATTYLRAKGCRTAASTYQNGVGGWAIQIRFTGQTVTWSVLGSSINYFVLVNGKPVNTAGYAQASNGRIEVNCGSSGDWVVTLILRQDQAVMGVFTDGQIHAQTPSTNPMAKVLYIGDSYTGSTVSPSSTISEQGIPNQLRLMHGFDVDVIAHGIGSSGYTTGNLLTNSWRYEDAASVNPDLIVLMFGTNDVGQPDATVSAGVFNGLASLKSSCPNAKILAGFVWPQSRNLSAALLATESAIQSACQSSGVPFYPINTIGASLPVSGALDTPWVWGDGDTNTAETVAGNSKWVTGDDGVHPSPAFGSRYLANRVVDAVLDSCKKLGW